MGWWQIGPAGVHMDDRATGLLWGDELADILDAALDQIRAAYRREWDRDISHDELQAGFNFSTGASAEAKSTAKTLRHADNSYYVKLTERTGR